LTIGSHRIDGNTPIEEIIASLQEHGAHAGEKNAGFESIEILNFEGPMPPSIAGPTAALPGAIGCSGGHILRTQRGKIGLEK
jgi:hypothetical protein